MFVYTYLYQNHVNSTYDTYMTEELVKAKPMITWEVNVTELNPGNITDLDGLKVSTAGDHYEDGYLDKTQMAPIWMDRIENNARYSVTNTINTDHDGNKGYLGIVNSGATTINQPEIVEYDTYFDFTTDSNGNDISQILYKQGGIKTTIDDNGGTVIIKDDGSETGKALLYVPLFPFVFAHGYEDDINDTADYYTYSLTAYVDPNYLSDASNARNITYDESLGWTKMTFFDIVEDTFSGNINWSTPTNEGFAGDYLESLFTSGIASNTLSPVEVFNLWLFDYVYDNSMDTLSKDAQQYWRNEGFYIELHGEYKDSYADLIPAWIQK